MFRLGYLCLVLFMGCQHAAGSPVSVPDYEYVREADAWLRLHSVPAAWSDAAVRCQLEGGMLASPTTNAMTEAMLDAMKKRKLASNRVFIGITDIRSSGKYESLDGEDLPVDLEWIAGDSYEFETTYCLELTDTGKLTFTSCSRELPYFCRKSIHNCPSSPSTEDSADNYSYYADVDSDTDDSKNSEDEIPTSSAAQECDGNGYEWEPRTGSCYKFHRAAKPWRSALSTCHAEGGHLAIINSATESTVLKELYEQNNHTVITGTSNPYYASIGFRKWGGEWVTVQGETLAEAGFEEWSPGEPNGLGEENCGTMYWDGLLNDASCGALFPYICEKTPKINDFDFIPFTNQQ
ncbi:lymphocyte antigen 75-like [Cydia splendana]|uniref:lymphocyte antigen 75-like n=1 Tax=Cydia splendana TaxID=1100963 RepID=UPI00300CDE1D